MSTRPSQLPALSAADISRLASRGADLSRLTTPPLGPSLEHGSALASSAQSFADRRVDEGRKSDRSLVSVGVRHALNMQRREGSQK